MRNPSISAATLTLMLTITLGACSRSDEPWRAMAQASRAQHAGFSSAIPILRVEDLRASQRYYRDVLGFKLIFEDGDPPDFGGVKRGEAMFFMCQRCQGT